MKIEIMSITGNEWIKQCFNNMERWFMSCLISVHFTYNIKDNSWAVSSLFITHTRYWSSLKQESNLDWFEEQSRIWSKSGFSFSFDKGLSNLFLMNFLALPSIVLNNTTDFSLCWYHAIDSYSFESLGVWKDDTTPSSSSLLKSLKTFFPKHHKWS